MPVTQIKFFPQGIREKKLYDERVRRDRNNGVAAPLTLTPFKTFVMKRGFVLILLIHHSDAHEQGTLGLIKSD